MILHLLIHGQRTEKQFATYVLQQFSAPMMCSEFVFMSSVNGIGDYESFPNVRIVYPEIEEEFSLFLDSLVNYSAIVFHGLFEPWCEVVLRSVPDGVKVAWVFWGGEIYGRHDLSDSFVAPRSKFVCKIRTYLNRIRGKRKSHFEVPKNLYKRIDYCLTDMVEEYEFAKKYLNTPEMKFLWYNYYSIDETLGSLADSSCNGNNIIIGNSATIECNFFDTFSIIRNIIRQGSHVIVPLGYGSPWVRNLVVKYGRRVFNDSFVPLVDYMPRSEYNKVLLSCSTMIQPHYRPQAQGNIITGIWLGMCVYLSEKNFAYQYFKRIGVQVFSIEKDLRNRSASCLEMDLKTVEMNRRVLMYWYGKEEMKNRVLDLVSVLESKE